MPPVAVLGSSKLWATAPRPAEPPFGNPGAEKIDRGDEWNRESSGQRPIRNENCPIFVLQELAEEFWAWAPLTIFAFSGAGHVDSREVTFGARYPLGNGSVNIE